MTEKVDRITGGDISELVERALVERVGFGHIKLSDLGTKYEFYYCGWGDSTNLRLGGSFLKLSPQLPMDVLPFALQERKMYLAHIQTISLQSAWSFLVIGDLYKEKERSTSTAELPVYPSEIGV